MEFKHPCEKQMDRFAHICSSRVLVLSGHHDTRHCGGILGCPPYPSTCCFSKTCQVFQKVVAFKPATLHFNLRSQETERDFRGVCLSSSCTIFPGMCCILRFMCTDSPTAYWAVRELWGWVGSRLHCWMVTEMRLYP